MDFAVQSSDGDPRPCLVEPFIYSLVVCSAWLGSLEFKWAPLTSVSNLQLYLDAHKQQRHNRYECNRITPLHCINGFHTIETIGDLSSSFCATWYIPGVFIKHISCQSGIYAGLGKFYIKFDGNGGNSEEVFRCGFLNIILFFYLNADLNQCF